MAIRFDNARFADALRDTLNDHFAEYQVGVDLYRSMEHRGLVYGTAFETDGGKLESRFSVAIGTPEETARDIWREASKAADSIIGARMDAKIDAHFGRAA